MLALVNRGVGVALVSSSSQAMQMSNLTLRQIDMPPQFHSDVYPACGPNARTLLHDRVRATIMNALADFAPARRGLTEAMRGRYYARAMLQQSDRAGY